MSASLMTTKCVFMTQHFPKILYTYFVHYTSILDFICYNTETVKKL